MRVAVIDYGAGNLKNVTKALQVAGADVIVTEDSDLICSAEKVILPGVGAFAEAMERLKNKKLDAAIKKYLSSGKPFLGICLGMQLLFQFSEEGDAPGLGVLDGRILHIPQVKGIKIPQMGWNNVVYTKKSRLFEGIPNSSYFYFVHSYYLDTDDREIISATTDHGINIDIAVEHKNIFATQFHPEKSGKMGIKLLENFVGV